MVSLFIENTDTSYISDGEIMDRRAINPNKWSEDRASILTEDFRSAIENARHPNADGLHLLGAFQDSQAVGLALSEYISARRDRYVVLRDMVVATSMRGQALGGGMLKWLDDKFRQDRIDKMFLESGVENEAAHRFFVRHGFTVCAVAMYKEIQL